MGGGVLDPNNPYLIPFKILAVTPLALAGMAAAPLVVSGGVTHGHRLLSPAYTLGGLAQKGMDVQRKGQRLKVIVTALGLVSGTNVHHDIYGSSGGGGPGESLTSTDPPLALEEVVQEIEKASEHTSSLAAAGNSAHGGRRSGSKPRCRAVFRGDGRSVYPVPVRCQKKTGHRGKHRAGRFYWK